MTLAETKALANDQAVQGWHLNNIPGLMRVYRPTFADWTALASAKQTGLNSKDIGDGTATLKQVILGGREAVQMTVTALEAGKQANGFAHADFAATMGMPQGFAIPGLSVEMPRTDSYGRVTVYVVAAPSADIQLYLNKESEPRPENYLKGVGRGTFALPTIPGVYKCVFKAWLDGKVIAITEPVFISVGNVPLLTDITDTVAEGSFWYDDDLQAFECGGAHYMNGWNAIANVQFGKDGLQLWNDYSTSWVPQIPANLLNLRKGQWNSFAVHTQFGKNTGTIRQVWLNGQPYIFNGSFSFVYTPGIMPGRQPLVAEKLTLQWQRDFVGTLAVSAMEYRIYNRNLEAK